LLDDDGLGAADPRQLPAGAHGVGRGLLVAGRVLELDADPGADQREAAAVELVPQLAGIGGHEPPVAELGADVARLVHLVDDPPVAVAVSLDALDHAPGAGGVGDANHVATPRRPRGPSLGCPWPHDGVLTTCDREGLPEAGLAPRAGDARRQELDDLDGATHEASIAVRP
jgi:hypothetical protein